VTGQQTMNDLKCLALWAYLSLFVQLLYSYAIFHIHPCTWTYFIFIWLLIWLLKIIRLVRWNQYTYKERYCSYRKSLFWTDFNHSSEQILTVWWNKVGNMKYSPFYFLQKLSQIVIVEWESSNEKCVEYHTTWPHIRFLTIVFLSL